MSLRSARGANGVIRKASAPAACQRSATVRAALMPAGSWSAPEAFDAGQSWEAPNSRFRDQGPHRRGSELWNPPQAQCCFDAFGDAEAGRHVRVRRKLDGAAGDRAERETIGAPHFDLEAVARESSPVDRLRLFCDHVADKADHRRRVVAREWAGRVEPDCGA